MKVKKKKKEVGEMAKHARGRVRKGRRWFRNVGDGAAKSLVGENPNDVIDDTRSKFKKSR
jgi:hypothetical protein